ncbi:MAG: L-seryl-tRNA(Sec) selenium transferase [Acidobacteriaceae bacterium]
MAAVSKTDLFRKLPSIDELLRWESLSAVIEREGRAATTQATREVLERLRVEIAEDRLDIRGLDDALTGLSEAVQKELRASLAYSLRPVINATGVILHTNLGRAPLTSAALVHAREVATSYSNLEFDLQEGERGKRDVHTGQLFERLFAGHVGRKLSTVVVNNNAAAVMLGLNTLAEGGEVIVSRGELVEIGGSFRIPDVMAKSQAVLREVGTTNRTRIADYERAINDRTRLLLKVHRSNFQIVGFAEEPTLEELVALGQKHDLPVMEDLGSGALMDLRSVGIAGEPTVYESLRAGADVVTYSGDKMLGGPQSGMLTGTPETIARIRSNPMFRALRVDKLIYATLEASLVAYLKQDFDAIPTLRMMRESREDITARAGVLHDRLRLQPTLRVELVSGESVVGGGAAPGSTLPTTLLAVTRTGMSANALNDSLRANQPPIIARVEDGRVLLDLRTVFPGQENTVAAALERISQ